MKKKLKDTPLAKLYRSHLNLIRAIHKLADQQSITNRTLLQIKREQAK